MNPSYPLLSTAFPVEPFPPEFVPVSFPALPHLRLMREWFELFQEYIRVFSGKIMTAECFNQDALFVKIPLYCSDFEAGRVIDALALCGVSPALAPASFGVGVSIRTEQNLSIVLLSPGRGPLRFDVPPERAAAADLRSRFYVNSKLSTDVADFVQVVRIPCLSWDVFFCYGFAGTGEELYNCFHCAEIGAHDWDALPPKRC